MPRPSDPAAPRLSEGVDPAHLAAAVRLFWDAFGAKLGVALGPAGKALPFLTRCAIPARALSAVDGGSPGRLCGLATLRDAASGGFIGAGFGDLRAGYGTVGALWRGALLSLIDSRPQPGALMVESLCVAPEAGGRGIGTALLMRAADRARAQGYRQLVLDVIEENDAARRLYERLGFRATGSTATGPLRPVLGFRRVVHMALPLEAAPLS